MNAARSAALTPSCSSPTLSKRSLTRSFCVERGLVGCGRCFKGPRRTHYVTGRRFSCLLPSCTPLAATERPFRPSSCCEHQSPRSRFQRGNTAPVTRTTPASHASQRERRVAQLRVCHLTAALPRRRTSAPSPQRAAIERFPTVRLKTAPARLARMSRMIAMSAETTFLTASGRRQHRRQ